MKLYRARSFTRTVNQTCDISNIVMGVTAINTVHYSNCIKSTLNHYIAILCLTKLYFGEKMGSTYPENRKEVSILEF